VNNPRPPTTSPVNHVCTPPAPSSLAAARRMQANRRRDTRPELALRSELHRRGLRFRVDHPLRTGGRTVRPDIVFSRARVAVYVDGCFWHGCPLHATSPKANAAYWTPKLKENVERDRRTTNALEADGWTVLRIWEHVSPSDAAGTVAEIVRQRSTPS
jgi:DNA mismatch endonuclease (patch repair protein)